MRNKIVTLAAGLCLCSSIASAATFTFNSKDGKTTLVDADIFGLEDSAASFAVKKVTAANLKAYVVSGVPSTASTLVGDCTVGPCLDGTSDGGNIIKLWAGTGSYWTAIQGGAPAANRSWRLPIAAAPAAGATQVMTMDQYGQMGFMALPSTSGYVLSSTDAGVLSWAAGGSGSMTWPATAGIAVYGGSSAWGTSLTLDTDISSVSASDDSIPSAKAVKAAIDLLPGIADGTGISFSTASGTTTIASIGTVVGTSIKSANYTIGTDSAREAYGWTFYVNGTATITAPAVASGMSFAVVTIGDIAVSLDVNAADKMVLDGVTLADGDKATNSSKAGDTIVCQYYSADGYYCWSSTVLGGHWTDGN